MIKKYKLLIIGLIVFGTILGSFHYHDDIHASEDCQICVIQNLLSLSDVPEVFSLTLLTAFFYAFILPPKVPISTVCFSAYPSRAPPSFS